MKNKPYFLYADDDEDDVILLKDMLQLSGSDKEIISVKDGYAALQYLQKIQQGETYPCLIILDIEMPRLNGKETLELLKTDDIYCLIPVIILSVNNSESNTKFCSQLGSEIISKPKTFDGWGATIKKINEYLGEGV